MFSKGADEEYLKGDSSSIISRMLFPQILYRLAMQTEIVHQRGLGKGF